MQLHGEVEETFALHRRQEFGAVGIDVAPFAAPLAGLGRVEDARGLVAVGLDPDEGDLLAGGRAFHPAHQFVQRQHAAFALLHRETGRVHGAQDLVLERQHAAGHAHQGEHQAGADTEHPVQLEPDFLHHFGLAFNPQRSATAEAAHSIDNHPQAQPSRLGGPSLDKEKPRPKEHRAGTAHSRSVDVFVPTGKNVNRPYEHQKWKFTPSSAVRPGATWARWVL
ncbi:hypothetical protein D9M71_181630 [compost metagenome]